MLFAKRSFRVCALSSIAFGTTSWFSTAENATNLFRRLSFLSSAQPCSSDDLHSLVEALSQGEAKGVSRNATAWRTLGSASYLVPFIEGSRKDELMLLTFPDASGAASKIFGVFTTEQSFDQVKKANKEKKLIARKMNAEEIYDAMKQLADPKAPAHARVEKLSIDAKLIFSWAQFESRWKNAVEVAWTQKTIQTAQTTEEIDQALREVLGDRGQWLMIEHKRSDGTFAPTAHDMGGKPHILVFLDADIALRVFEESSVKFHRANNKALIDFAKAGTQNVGLVHDALPDGRLGFVSIDKARAERIVQNKK